MPSLSEALTEQFYDWEQRGRGWALWHEPVVLEPPFTPFVRYLPSVSSGDDGHRPSIITRLWRRILGTARDPVEESWLLDDADTTPEPDTRDRAYAELQIRIPEDVEITPERAEQLLFLLATLRDRVAFEVVGIDRGIVLQLGLAKRDLVEAREALRLCIPEAAVTETPTLIPAWCAAGGKDVVVDFGLSREFMLPLAAPHSFKLDPLTGLVAALQGLGRGEFGLLQVLFEPASARWAVEALRAVSDGEGHAFFADAPETLGLARQKLSRPLFACVMRVAAKAPTDDRAWDIVRRVGGALQTFADPLSNEFMPLSNDGYNNADHTEDLLSRRSRRSGMLLASDELAGIVHLPASSLEVESLRAAATRTKAAPEELFRGDIVLGENVHRGQTGVVMLRDADRLRHMHVIGATGTGKSTFLLHLIREDLEAGRGVALLDPHGDLADTVVRLVPERRVSEVVLFDPADEEHPIGFNVLHARSEREREILGSDLVGIFRRFATSWGDQMSAVLGNAVAAFLEREEGGTLLELRRFLGDRGFRADVLRSCRDPLLASFWKNDFPRLSGSRSELPLVTRLDMFLRPRLVRRIVAQRDSRLDLAALVERGGIFVGRLSQGAIGEENAYLLGSLLVAKFQQLAMARAALPERDRHPFFLYLDEFHHFATPSLAALLSGARKYGLGLVVAHQQLRQLSEELRSAVLTNPGTRVVFRVGDDDARALASGFRSFEPEDLMSLSLGHAICRVGQADHDFSLGIQTVEVPDDAVGRAREEAVRTHSRGAFASSRLAVDAGIAELWGREAPAEEPEVRRTVVVRKAAPGAHEPPSQPEPEPVTGEAAQRSAEPKARPAVVPTPGRGGAEHKYLQSLIKSYAEGKGFRATIEAAAGEGCSIDVLLERGERRIACEISVTTGAEHELGNVVKCLEAGIPEIVVVSPSPVSLKKIEARVRPTLAPELSGRVRFMSPTEFIEILNEEPEAAEVASTSVLGYRVSVKSVGGDERRSKAVTRTIVDALRRMRGK